jgi:hypothetical protein
VWSVCEELRKIQIRGQIFYFTETEGREKSAEVALQLYDCSSTHSTSSGIAGAAVKKL